VGLFAHACDDEQGAAASGAREVGDEALSGETRNVLEAEFNGGEVG